MVTREVSPSCTAVGGSNACSLSYRLEILEKVAVNRKCEDKNKDSLI